MIGFYKLFPEARDATFYEYGRGFVDTADDDVQGYEVHFKMSDQWFQASYDHHGHLQRLITADEDGIPWPGI